MRKFFLTLVAMSIACTLVAKDHTIGNKYLSRTFSTAAGILETLNT